MADGGEGTVDAVLAATGGERRVSTVQGPLGAEVQAARGWLNESRTAVIEMAAASGIHLVLAAERDATRASHLRNRSTGPASPECWRATNNHGVWGERDQ